MQPENKSTKKIRLAPRLKKIAELVPVCGTVADIGTDHAYIPSVLVASGRASRAIASDIVPGPVARARATVRGCGLVDRIDVRLGAGLETVAEGEADVIIIAGMGGILISEILENSRSVTDCAELIILQPMTAVTELREYLGKGGYTVCGEYLVKEENKLYNIITAIPRGNTEYSVRELYLGRNTEKTSPELFAEYRERVISKLRRRAEGLKKSALAENAARLEEINGIITELT